LNNALRSSGLFSLQQEEAPITLDTQIAGGGGNLSVGQRQIIALARAIVRGSKLLILDEGAYAHTHCSANFLMAYYESIFSNFRSWCVWLSNILLSTGLRTIL
jgi:ABC-type transport system involved in cytochrome bd biosynthesis fused ATPase/permease subunit